MKSWTLGAFLVCAVALAVVLVVVLRPSGDASIGPAGDSERAAPPADGPSSHQPGVMRPAPRASSPQPPDDRADASKPGAEAEPPPDPAYDVKGRVIDEQGVAVAGVRVCAVYRNMERLRSHVTAALGNMSRNDYKDMYPYTETDGEGRFSVNTKAKGPHLLVTWSPEYMETIVPIDVPAGDNEFVLTVKKGLPIAGRVVLEGLGDPVEGVKLWTFQRLDRVKHPYLSGRGKHGETRGDGSFLFQGFSPGKVFLSLRIDRDKPYRPVATATVQAGDQNIELEVVSVGTIVFRVVEEGSGEPVLFRLHPRIQGRKKYYAVVRMSEEEGRGRWALLCPAGTRKVRFECQGYEPVTVDFVVPIGERKEHGEPIVFRKQPALEGTLSFTPMSGLPGTHPHVEASRVFYERLDGKDREIKVWRVAQISPYMGRYRIPTPPPGRYSVVAVVPGHRPERAVVDVGENGAAYDFHMSPRQPGDPPPLPKYPYKERKDLRLSFDVEDIRVDETVHWLVAVTGAGLRLRPGTKVGNSRIQMQMQGLPLAQVCRFICAMCSLTIDEETGEVYQKE